MLYSMVVPCYNEEKNLPLILERYAEVIGDASLEVLMVDNGSTDGSAAALDELLPRYPFARRVTVPENQGYGYGILQGLAAAKGDWLGWTHADMQADPADVIRACEMAKRIGRGVYLKGNRVGRPVFDQFFTSGMSLFESVYLGQKLWDINAQPNLFPRAFYETWQGPPHDFSLDLYALYMAQAQGLEVVRFNVRFPPRIHGESNWNTSLSGKWKFIRRTVEFSTKLKKGGIR